MIRKHLFILLIALISDVFAQNDHSVFHAKKQPTTHESLFDVQIEAHQKAMQALSSQNIVQVSLNNSLKVGMTDNSLPDILHNLKALGYDVAEDKTHTYHSGIERVVQMFQRDHFLKADGVIGPQTLQMLNKPTAARINELKRNAEKIARVKKEYEDSERLVVNVPTFTLYALKDGRVELSSPVIVGKPDTPTPEMVTYLIAATANPVWSVPRGVLENHVLPKIQKDPNYLRKMGFTVENQDGQRIDGHLVNWYDPSEYLHVKLRQKPGDDNALGRIKLNLDNPQLVAIHYTPHPEQFNEANRAQSSGCVRVQNIQALADWVLSNRAPDSIDDFKKAYESRKNKQFNIRDKLPVHFIYVSTWLGPDGHMQWNNPYKK